jgi:GDP-L-fucose synthase
MNDMAAAVVFALENKLPVYIQCRYWEDLTIRELAETIQKITGHTGEIIWDATKPDGTQENNGCF